jgi:osmotically inducible protein OsmC
VCDDWRTPDAPPKETTMAEIRRADATWEGDLLSGSGAVSASTSGAFSDLPVSWASRTEASNGKTSPEELIASAHAACFSMAFSSNLAKAGFTAERLSVSAEVTFDKLEGGWTVTKSALTVRGRVPGIDEATFAAAAEAAKDGCPVSRAIKGNVELSVDATLEG